MMPKHCGVPRPMSPLWWLPINHDWLVHSLMLSLHHLRGLPLWWLPSSVPCSMVFSSHGQTTITCDTWQLTIKVPDVQRGYWPAAKRIHFMLSLWHAKHAPVAFVSKGFKGLDLSLWICSQHSALTSVEQQWQDEWFVTALFLHSTASLVMKIILLLLELISMVYPADVFSSHSVSCCSSSSLLLRRSIS